MKHLLRRLWNWLCPPESPPENTVTVHKPDGTKQFLYIGPCIAILMLIFGCSCSTRNIPKVVTTSQSEGGEKIVTETPYMPAETAWGQGVTNLFGPR